ncbi:MAG TPA: gluconate 2-dehydrogenase subunit 3 family protein [Gemmatimonadales bacterium]|nr:gluconate 2-dehydrogenase subunit 3 family protein [Gemmatimonadales bacterium]
MSYDRRDFLTLAGTALGALWLGADPKALRASLTRARDAREALARGDAPPPFEVLTPEQAADLEAIAARIIPTDDLPGAREVRAVNFIDHGLATWAADRRQDLLDGHAAFATAITQRHGATQRFADLSETQQDEFLAVHEDDDFFEDMLFFTVAGTFSYPDWGGNYQGAGWKILGFDDRYIWQPPFGWYDAKQNGGPN